MLGGGTDFCQALSLNAANDAQDPVYLPELSGGRGGWLAVIGLLMAADIPATRFIEALFGVFIRQVALRPIVVAGGSSSGSPAFLLPRSPPPALAS